MSDRSSPVRSTRGRFPSIPRRGLIRHRDVGHRGPPLARLREQAHQLVHLFGHFGVDVQAQLFGLVHANRIIVRPSPGRQLLSDRLRFLG